jgi:hypothetical protein
MRTDTWILRCLNFEFLGRDLVAKSIKWPWCVHSESISFKLLECCVDMIYDAWLERFAFASRWHVYPNWNCLHILSAEKVFEVHTENYVRKNFGKFQLRNIYKKYIQVHSCFFLLNYYKGLRWCHCLYIWSFCVFYRQQRVKLIKFCGNLFPF